MSTVNSRRACVYELACFARCRLDWITISLSRITTLLASPFTWVTVAQPAGGGGNTFEFPPELDVDYGKPLDGCRETGDMSGVFERRWSRAAVRLDCNSYTAKITHF